MGTMSGVLSSRLDTSMAVAAAAASPAAPATRSVLCELRPRRSGVPARRRPVEPSPEGGKILLQPRLCTLRSYGTGERGALIKMATVREGAADVSSFFASLAEYVESSRRSQDFETVSGRLAMIAFANAVSMEVVTGNSLFKKMDLQQIAEAGGVCVAVVACAATFAWFSSARTRIGQMFTLGRNSFVDSLIDNIVDGLFYESDQSDWFDEV